MSLHRGQPYILFDDDVRMEFLLASAGVLVTVVDVFHTAINITTTRKRASMETTRKAVDIETTRKGVGFQ